MPTCLLHAVTRRPRRVDQHVLQFTPAMDHTLFPVAGAPPTMRYHQINPDTLSAAESYPCDRRAISDAAELLALHAATYEMAPGEQLSRTYHYHKPRE